METTDTRLPLWVSEDGAQETSAVLEPSSRTPTAWGRCRRSISTGGKDTSIMQWRLVEKSSVSLTDGLLSNSAPHRGDPVVTLPSPAVATPTQDHVLPPTTNGTQEPCPDSMSPTKEAPPTSELTPPHSVSTSPPSDSTVSLKDSLEPSDDTVTPSDEGLPPLPLPSDRQHLGV